MARDSWERSAALVRHLNIVAPPHLQPRNIKTLIEIGEEVEVVIPMPEPNMFRVQPPPRCLIQTSSVDVHTDGACAELSTNMPSVVMGEQADAATQAIWASRGREWSAFRARSGRERSAFRA